MAGKTKGIWPSDRMRNASESRLRMMDGSITWRLVVSSVVLIVAIQSILACSDTVPTSGPDDPNSAKELVLSVPYAVCLSARDSGPFQISVDVTVEGTLNEPHFAWIAIYRSLSYGDGALQYSAEHSFLESATIVFDDVPLSEGDFLVDAGLTRNSGDIYSSYLRVPAKQPLLVELSGICVDWETFQFNYYRQENCNAFPSGLAYSQDPFHSAEIALMMWQITQSLPRESLYIHLTDPVSPDMFNDPIDYLNSTIGSFPYNSRTAHLIAIYGFYTQLGSLAGLSLGWTLLDVPPYGNDVTFVCAGQTLNSFPSSLGIGASLNRWVSTHELGHLTAELSDICDANNSLALHVSPECVMNNVTYDPPSQSIVLFCDRYSPNQWPLTQYFCDSCIGRLELMTW